MICGKDTIQIQHRKGLNWAELSWVRGKAQGAVYLKVTGLCVIAGNMVRLRTMLCGFAENRISKLLVCLFVCSKGKRLLLHWMALTTIIDSIINTIKQTGAKLSHARRGRNCPDYLVIRNTINSAWLSLNWTSLGMYLSWSLGIQLNQSTWG